MYVVNSTALIPVIQRQFRTLAFTPIEARSAEYAMGGSKTATEILAKDMTGDKGYLMSFAKYIHPSVTPGMKLDDMNWESVKVISASMDEVRKVDPFSVKMFEWIRHEIVMATTEGVYGHQNPFRDSAVELAW